MSDYLEAALAAAHDSGLTPDDVRALDFAGVCELAGVDAAARPVPADYCYEPLRAQVASVLQAEVEQASQDALEQAVADAIAGNPDLSSEQVAAVSRGFDPSALATRIDQARVSLIASGALPMREVAK